MKKLTPMVHFDYSKERLVEADMDKRDRSYIVKLVNYMNEQTIAHNALVDAVRRDNREVEEAVRKQGQDDADEEKKKKTSKKSKSAFSSVSASEDGDEDE